MLGLLPEIAAMVADPGTSTAAGKVDESGGPAELMLLAAFTVELKTAAARAATGKLAAVPSCGGVTLAVGMLLLVLVCSLSIADVI